MFLWFELREGLRIHEKIWEGINEPFSSDLDTLE